MKEFNYLKLFKIWIISLAGLNVFTFGYLMLVGRVFEEPYGSGIVSAILIFALVTSVIVAIINIVYAIIIQNTKYIFVGIGTLGLSFMLWLLLVILAIATIY